MKALIIDNHTGRIPDWERILKLYKFKELKVVRAEEFKFGDENEFDLVVLTGATGLAIPTHLEEYAQEFELIKHGEVPIVGVCVGFQAIVVAFGGELKYREVDGIKGVIDIDVVKKDTVFGDFNKFRGYESHKYYVTELPSGLVKLAESKYNIEAVKNISKPIYGFQFHPEVTDPKNDGSVIFGNLINTIFRNI